jgi:hypothetical protein
MDVIGLGVFSGANHFSPTLRQLVYWIRMDARSIPGIPEHELVQALLSESPLRNMILSAAGARDASKFHFRMPASELAPDSSENGDVDLLALRTEGLTWRCGGDGGKSRGSSCCPRNRQSMPERFRQALAKVRSREEIPDGKHVGRRASPHTV